MTITAGAAGAEGGAFAFVVPGASGSRLRFRLLAGTASERDDADDVGPTRRSVGMRAGAVEAAGFSVGPCPSSELLPLPEEPTCTMRSFCCRKQKKHD